MDGNDQKNNVDGIRPPEQQAPVSNVDGFVTNPRTEAPQPRQSYDTDIQSQQAQPSQVDSQQVDSGAVQANDPPAEKPKKDKKGVAVWLVIVLILLFSAAAAAGVYFWQSNQSKSDVDAEKAKTAQAMKQQVDQLSKTNEDLTKQNAALQSTIQTQQAYIDAVAKIAAQLKAACGKNCDPITVPPTPTVSPTPTATVAPTATPTVAPTATPTPTPTKAQ